MEKNSFKELHCANCENFESSLLKEFELKDLAFPHKRILEFRKNDILFKEGEDVTGVFCLYSGKVKLVKRGFDQKVHIIRLAKSGDLLGLSSIDNARYEKSAVAIDFVTACFIPKNDLLDLLRRNSHFPLKIMKIICQEIEKTEQRLSELVRKTARERLADMLLNLKIMFGTDDNRYLNILLSRKDLADFIGTTNETCSRLMNDFQRKQLIHIESRKIQLLDLEKLKQVARIGKEKAQSMALL